MINSSSLVIRIKSALNTVKNIQIDYGSDCMVTIGKESHKASTWIKRLNKALRAQKKVKK